MEACPYCGESIKKEAKLCRHCDRPVLYDLWINESLDDRTQYDLIKSWMSYQKSGFKHASFSSLTDGKLQLSKLPLILAWSLTSAQAESIQKDFPKISFEKKLNNDISSELQTQQQAENKSGRIASYFYGIAALALVGFLGFYMVGGKKLPVIGEKEEKTLSQIELSQPNSPLKVTTEQAAVPKEPAYPAPRSDAELANPRRSGQLSRQDIQRLLNSTVFIQERGKLGSGFLITDSGYILSNSHVTANMAKPIVILRNGQKFQATKVSENKRLDISLLKISVSNAPYLEMGDANQLYAGQNVITIGNPSGLSFTVTRGIVSFVGRRLNGVSYIQTDAAINPGNSGGPMITDDLKVVGINTLTAKVEKGISFALPINYAYSSGGIASGIGRYPASSPAFRTSDDPVQYASADSNPSFNDGNSGPSLDKDHYKEEAEELKAKLQRRESSYNQRASELKLKEQEILAELENNPTQFSRVEKLKLELEEVQEEKVQIYRDLLNHRIQYIKAVIGVLQRQKGDSRFSSISNQIDQQIKNLRTQRKELESQLDL